MKVQSSYGECNGDFNAVPRSANEEAMEGLNERKLRGSDGTIPLFIF